MSRQFETIGVVGLGTMGAGIAEVFARNGYAVIGVEQTAAQLEVGQAHIRHSTDRAVKRGKLSAAEQQAIFDQLTLTTSLADLADCDLVIEAVVERLDLKRAIFRQLDEIVRPDAVLATNTSSLSVTEIAAATSSSARVIGLHFFNPAPVQQLVEVIRTVVTDTEVITDVLDLARKLGKQPVAAGDRAGFIANALLFGYLNSAVSMYESRYASREDIDAAMELGCGYPMGPLRLLDLIGLDTAYEILETMYLQSRNRRHAPSPLLRQLVSAGLLGRKTGRGFYTYGAAGSPVVTGDADTPSQDPAARFRRQITRVGVVGLGPMATGIVDVFASGGYDVTQVPGFTMLDDLADADLVVEAVAEEMAAKKALFERLGEVCRPGGILATTTSRLPVIELAVATGRPADVVGMHFFAPVDQVKLVEVVSTVATDGEVAETVRAVCAAVGKHAVCCADRAGFIVNALLFPYLNDAVRMLEAHYADADEIDTAMRAGCALPMGPFEVLDVVGADVSLAIQRRLFEEIREPGLSPAPLLEQLVTAGYLGQKSGSGFRDYSTR